MAGRRPGSALLVLALLLGVAASIPAKAEAGIIKRLDYESGGLGQWSYVQALPGRISVVKSPRRQGKFAARFVVKPGDSPVGGSGERAELSALTSEHAGMRSWWRWSTFFPRHLNPVRGTWNIYMQWHQTEDACPPPVQFTIDASNRPARMYLKLRGGSLNSKTCAPSSQKSFRIGTLRRDHWYSFRFAIKWSPRKSRGYVSLWMNGKRRAHGHTATLYRGQGVYVKQGFYRGPSSKTSVIYQDGLQRFRP
jgi:hypothetical protein